MVLVVGLVDTAAIVNNLYTNDGLLSLPFLNPARNPTVTLALPLDSKCFLIL